MKKVLLFLGILSLAGCDTYKFLAGEDVWVNGSKKEKGCHELTDVILFGDFPLKVTATADGDAVKIGEVSEHKAAHYKYQGGALAEGEATDDDCKALTEEAKADGAEAAPATGVEAAPATGVEAAPATGVEAAPATGVEAAPATGGTTTVVAPGNTTDVTQ